MGDAVFKDMSDRVPPSWPYGGAALDRLEKEKIHIELAENPAAGDHLLSADVRFLAESDLDALHRVHLEVVGTISHPHVYRADDKDFMAAHLRRRGRTLGVFHDDSLIGYAALSFPKGDSDNLGPLAPIPEAECDRVAQFDGSGVLEEYRGNSIQRTLNDIRGRFAVAAGYHHLMGTVSPLNPHSLNNMLATGFQIVNFAVKYGGMDRFVVYRDGAAENGGIDHVAGSARVVALSEREDLQAALADGYVGHDVRQENGEFGVVFSKMSG